MNQEAKEYIINKYGEETYNGVIDGTIFINDKTLNEMMPKRKFNVEVGKLPKEKLEVTYSLRMSHNTYLQAR
jgi:hypothetical protein